MIEVEAMQDELSIGHENRFAWVNNCRSSKEVTSLISGTLAEQGYEASAFPKLHQLALVSNKAPIDYVHQHSMLAVLRVAAKRGLDTPHGADNAHAFVRRLEMRTQRSGAYCCIECIKEDLQDRSFSWYRRKHHLVGVDWCLIHGCSLSKIDSPDPFSKLPHIWLSEDKLVAVNACEPNLPEEGFLRRYVEIATKLLDRERPFQVENITRCLAKRAKHHNLRIGRSGQRPLISDRLFEMAPIDWLTQHLPGCSTKIPMVYFNRIDSLALSKNQPGVGDAYSMAIAVLYESVDEALFDLSSTNGLMTTREIRKNRINEVFSSGKARFGWNIWKLKEYIRRWRTASA